MAFSLKFTGDGLPKFEAAVKALGETKARNAYRMALNDTNRKVYTEVKRVVARQMGVSQSAVVKHGKLLKRNASNGNLEAKVEAKGGFLPLSDFKAGQRRKGASAAPWAKRRIFPGTFIVGSLGGNVFKRTGVFADGKEKIEKLWGPAVPKELVKDESEKTFKRVANSNLTKEVERQIKRLSGGAIG